MFADRPRVTREEWKERVRPSLSYQGFTDHELDRLEALFEQSFQTNPAMPSWKPGIDQAALDQTMKYLRTHRDTAHFSDRQLDLIQSVLLKYISVRT